MNAAKRAWRYSLPWLVLAFLSALILVYRLQISFDISAFFPRQAELSHEILLEQFQNGPGSRILLAGLAGDDADVLADLSYEMRATLSGDALFSQVLNGEYDEEIDVPPEPIASHYLLMRDLEINKQTLQRAVDARLQDLAFGGGSAMIELIARDPYLVTLDVLKRLSPAEMSGGVWFAADGSAVLMIETRATAVDIEAQSAAVSRVRQIFSELADENVSLEITGAGAFGVELQATIRAEAQKRSILASLALIVVLLVFFRRPRYLLLASVPIGMGFLIGLTAVSLLFDSVHGITLAFGFTLMGVAIDYPLHLFGHTESASGNAAIDRIWPTMRLGAVSTAVAYVALAFSGSDGLAQLGVFTAVGILVAVIVTRTWVPQLMGEIRTPASSERTTYAVALNFLPAIVVLAVAIIGIRQSGDDSLWDDRLTSLSPVPAAQLVRDNVLRASTGALDMRYQIVVHDESLSGLLSKSEAVDVQLQQAVDDGLLQNWQSLTQLIASDTTQQRRKENIPDASTLEDWLTDVLADSPFHPDAFEPFMAVAESTRSGALLDIDQVRGTPLRSWLDAHLLQIGDQWIAMVTLTRPSGEALAERVMGWGDGVMLMDLRESSATLMRDYRNGAISTVSFAALIILALLGYQRRQPSQVLWITLSVASVLSATIAIIVLLHGQLTVIHLVALLLVMGLGLDYALFLSRTESGHERRATDKAVLACAVSTTLAFGLLAGSSIPVLKFIGLTVASGSALSYVVAVAGSGWLARKAS
jgi:predicted exporter